MEKKRALACLSFWESKPSAIAWHNDSKHRYRALLSHSK
jgi:heme-degrading monooxygenase HmoA